MTLSEIVAALDQARSLARWHHHHWVVDGCTEAIRLLTVPEEAPADAGHR